MPPDWRPQNLAPPQKPVPAEHKSPQPAAHSGQARAAVELSVFAHRNCDHFGPDMRPVAK